MNAQHFQQLNLSIRKNNLTGQTELLYKDHNLGLAPNPANLRDWLCGRVAQGLRDQEPWAAELRSDLIRLGLLKNPQEPKQRKTQEPETVDTSITTTTISVSMSEAIELDSAALRLLCVLRGLSGSSGTWTGTLAHLVELTHNHKPVLLRALRILEASEKIRREIGVGGKPTVYHLV